MEQSVELNSGYNFQLYNMVQSSSPNPQPLLGNRPLPTLPIPISPLLILCRSSPNSSLPFTLDSISHLHSRAQALHCTPASPPAKSIPLTTVRLQPMSSPVLAPLLHVLDFPPPPICCLGTAVLNMYPVDVEQLRKRGYGTSEE